MFFKKNMLSSSLKVFFIKMNSEIIAPQLADGMPEAATTFVANLFPDKAVGDNINDMDIDALSGQIIRDIEKKTNNKDKPKSWWQSVKSAFNRGKTEGKGGIKGFFKGCWEATKTGWRNTNKYVKTAIGAGCLLAGPLLMPLLSSADAGTSATSAALQSASKFSSWSYNISYIGYLLAHPTDALASSLIAPILSLTTGVGSLISGGIELFRDFAGGIVPKKIFNVAQSKWNDIIEYARYEHKQKCKLQNKNDINSKSFIISELNAVINAIKTEYKYFYNSNYPDGQDKDLQVVLNEYLKSLKERASKSQDNFKLHRANVYPEILQEREQQKVKLINSDRNYDNNYDDDTTNNNSNASSLNHSAGERKPAHNNMVHKDTLLNTQNTAQYSDGSNVLNMEPLSGEPLTNNKYNIYKNKTSKNGEIDINNLKHSSNNQEKSYLKNKF